MRTVEVDGLPIGDGHPPRIMSVLNMSENSGFDPSVHLDAAAAAAAVDEELVPAGADLIDVGLQSANPKYEPKPPAFELERLEAAADVIDRVESDVPIALETRYAEVAEAGLEAGFDLINDVCGFADPDMRPLVEAWDVPVIKMASPPDLDRPGALKTVDDVFEAIQRDGFTDRTIIDPAFGGWYDGRTHEDNWEMFRRLREFRAFGRPILTATNREDFLGSLADRPETSEQLPVSLAAATMEVERGAHVIRTHDTRETRDVVRVAHALGDRRASGRAGECSVTELPGLTPSELRAHAAVGDRLEGAIADGPTLSFSVTGLEEDDRAAIAEVAAAGAGTVVLGGDQATIVGTLDELAALADSLSTPTASVERVAATIRSAVRRERGE